MEKTKVENITRSVKGGAWFNCVDCIEDGEEMFKELFGFDATTIYYEIQNDGRYLVAVCFKDMIEL